MRRWILLVPAVIGVAGSVEARTIAGQEVNLAAIQSQESASAGSSVAVAASDKNINVRGVVISGDDNMPIIGATVIIKGTTTGTVTDFDGNFELTDVEPHHTIVFSYVGMENREEKVRPNINVTLSSSSQALEEVVVTGYGIVKKASFTGSASVVSTEKLKDVPTTGVQDRLAGAVAGVQIGSSSGQPGSVETVRIRGMGSVNAGNEPLYVIDGVPMTTGNASGFNYSQSGSSILSTINSNDIESMTVIKDAAAASLYGSRAANGVIVITTKQGKNGKTRFNVKSDWGFSNMSIDYRPTLNGQDRREMLHLGLVNEYLNKQSNITDEVKSDAKKYADGKIDSYAAEPWSGYTDWKDVLFRNGSHQNYEVSATGGNDKTTFFTSLSYTEQQGVSLQSEYERFTGRANVTHKTDRLTLNANVMLARSEQDVTAEKTSFGSPIMAIAMTVSPSAFPYNEDGTYNNTSFVSMSNGYANPLQTAMLNYDRSIITRAMGTASAMLNLYEGLNVKQTLNYDFNNTNNSVWWDPRSNDGRSSQGVMQRYMLNRSKLVSQSQLMYNTTFGDNHNFDALAAYEIEDFVRDYTYANGSVYATPGLPEISNASSTRSSSVYEPNRLISYLGRVNYDYASRYFISASFRRDGTSRLSEESRWGNFWSVSGSWRVSDESFMESLSNVITDAKVRASYGINGTQPSGIFEYMAIYKMGYNYNGEPGSAEVRFANDDLKWEKNYATNVGFEFAIKNRFFVNFDWYNRDTKDLLMEKPVSQTTGFENYYMNVGEMRNRGFELELRSENIRKKNFSWSTSFNIAHNNNTLQRLDGVQTEIISGNQIYKVGQPYYSFYLYEYAGVDRETGKESYYTNKGDNPRETTTDLSKADRIVAGAAQAKVQGGIINNISFKNFDLGFTLTYSLGGKVLDNASWIQSNGGSYNFLGNVPSYYKIGDTWTVDNKDAKLPQFAFGNTNSRSTRWLLSTDHLRVKNITLGYTAPKEWTNKLKVDKIRAFASAANLFTFMSKDMYLDPEVPVDGIATFETPSMRTVTFGIEIGF